MLNFSRISGVLLASIYLQALMFAQKPSFSSHPQAPPPLPANLDSSKVRNDSTSAPSDDAYRNGRGTVYAAELNVPKEPLREYQKGMEALKNSDAKAAEHHLQRASELYPKFSSAFNALGVAYELDAEQQGKAAGQNVAAGDAFRRAVALNPYNDKALTNLGFILLKEKNGVEAERVMRAAVAVHPASTWTCAGLMLAQAMQQHYDDVLATAGRIQHGEASQFPIVYFLRAVAWERKSDNSQAVRDYREFLRLSPEAHEAPNARAALKRLGSNQDSQEK